MFRSPLRGSIFAAATSLALLASGSSALAAPAAGELVSRADGADGAAYAYADLQAASSDGRFVAFANGPAGASDSTLVLRDRVAGTTTNILVDDAGAPQPAGYEWVATDVSDDGSEVLVAYRAPDSGVPSKAFLVDGATGARTAIDRAADGSTLATVDQARLVDGGAGVLYGGTDASGKRVVLRQSGAGAPELVASGVKLVDATRNGKVIVWKRDLVPATRPAGNTGPDPKRWPAQRTGTAVGYTVAGEAPRVVARTTVEEKTNAPGDFCADAGVSASTKSYDLAIDDYGHRLELTSSTFDDRYPSGPHLPQRIRYDLGEDGTGELWGIQNYGYPFRGWGQEAADTPLPETADYPDAWAYDARFFAHDSGILREELEDPRAQASPRVILAYAPVAPGTEPAAQTPAPLDGETADSATLTPAVSWDECDAPAEPPHLSTDLSVYAGVNLKSPASSRTSTGTVTVRRGGQAGVRPASRAQLQVKTLGLVTWTRTVEWSRQPGDAVDVQLPKPWLFVPQTLTVKVTSDKGYPTSTSAAESIQKTFRWTATR